MPVSLSKLRLRFYFSRIFFSAVVNLIGLPYISVPNRKIFAARNPVTAHVAARSTPDMMISHTSTLPMEIRINIPLLEVNGIKDATFINMPSLSVIPKMAIKKDTR